MALSPKNEDTLNRTYIGKIHLAEGMEAVLDEIGNFLGHVRRMDFAAKNNRGATRKQRLEAINGYGVTNAMAKSIISDNDAQVSLLWRNFKANRRQWHKDLKTGTDKQKENAEKRLSQTSPSIVLGGKRLWHQAQDDSSAMELFKKRRQWIGCVGRSRYVDKSTGEIRNTYGTNQGIRVTKSGELFINVPPSLRGSFLKRKLIIGKSPWLLLGTVSYGHGWSVILSSIEDDRSVTHHIEWNNNNKLVIRSQTQIDKCFSRARKVPRALAIDMNAGHIDVSIVDKYGNRVGRSRTYSFNRAKDIRGTIEKVMQWAARRGATAIVAEDLSGLQRGRTRSKKRALNRVISKIPTGELKRELVRISELRGWDLAFVDPSYTSVNTKYWRSVYDGDVHQLASFLIGRRGWGLRITREELKKSALRDSGLLVCNSSVHPTVSSVPFSVSRTVSNAAKAPD